MSKPKRQFDEQQIWLLAENAQEAIARLKKAWHVQTVDDSTLRIALEQTLEAAVSLSEVREALDGELVRRGLAKADDLKKKRVSDPTYIPTVEEGLTNPAELVKGMRES